MIAIKAAAPPTFVNTTDKRLLVPPIMAMPSPLLTSPISYLDFQFHLSIGNHFRYSRLQHSNYYYYNSGCPSHPN